MARLRRLDDAGHQLRRLRPWMSFLDVHPLLRLRELRIGQLVIYDVDAMVGENLNVSLLGQSFLTRLDSYEMRDGVLTLSYW